VGFGQRALSLWERHCIRHTPCADGRTRHTECAGYISLASVTGIFRAQQQLPAVKIQRGYRHVLRREIRHGQEPVVAAALEQEQSGLVRAIGRAGVAQHAGRCVPPVAQGRPTTAGRQQVLIQLPVLRLRRAFRPCPAQLGGGEGLVVLGIGNIYAPPKIQGGELLTPADAHPFDDQRIVERAEEGKGPPLAVLLAHENMGNRLHRKIHLVPKDQIGL